MCRDQGISLEGIQGTVRKEQFTINIHHPSSTATYKSVIENVKT
jgi:hypothetical protein